jgi:hypothetical protein
MEFLHSALCDGGSWWDSRLTKFFVHFACFVGGIVDHISCAHNRECIACFAGTIAIAIILPLGSIYGFESF